MKSARRLADTLGMRKLLFILVAIGCTTRLGALNLVTTENTAVAHTVIKRDAEGWACVIMWSNLSHPSVEDAVRDAVRSVRGADALMNVRIEGVYYPLARVLDKKCIHVQGDAVALGRAR